MLAARLRAGARSLGSRATRRPARSMVASSSRPSFLLLTHEFPPRRGGIATYAEEMARAAVALGFAVEVWAPAAGADAGDESLPYEVRRLPIRGTHGPRCVLRTARELIRERARLREATVLLAEPGPMLAWMVAGLLVDLQPRALLLAFHGSELLRWHDAPLIRWGLRSLLRRATRVATLTAYTEGLLRAYFPEGADQVCRTPGAPRSRRPVAPAAANTDRRADTGERPLVVLTVGRLHPRKGQVHTLAALQRLAPALRARVEYWIAGGQSKGGCGEALRAQAAAGDVPVRFLGEVADDELEHLYAEADLFALTSVEYERSVEGFGLVYLEAAAHGLPAIAHRVGGVDEAVIDGETGLCVTPNDPDALTAAFARLLGDAELRRRMGDAARVRARLANWTESARALLLSSPPAPVSR